MSDSSTDIGKIIQFHRKKAKLSQAKLAKFAGIGKTAVFDLEKGKLTVQFATLLAVLRVLNIHLKLESPIMQLFKEES